MKMFPILLLFGIPLTACQTTPPEIWNSGYPKGAAELTSEGAQKREFDRFAIRDLSNNSGSSRVNTADGGIYTFESFQPVMTEVGGPPVDEAFGDAKAFRTISQIGFWVGFFGLLASGQKDEAASGAGYAVWGIGWGTWLVANQFERESLDDARLEYMQGLNERIYGSPPSGATNRGPKIRFAWEF